MGRNCYSARSGGGGGGEGTKLLGWANANTKHLDMFEMQSSDCGEIVVLDIFWF